MSDNPRIETIEQAAALAKAMADKIEAQEVKNFKEFFGADAPTDGATFGGWLARAVWSLKL